MSKYNTISNFLFNNTTPILLPVPSVNRNQGKSQIDLSEKALVWRLVVRLAEYAN